MVKQCGSCEFWEREFTLFTSFTIPKQVKAKCRNDASPTNNYWMLSINDGQDCPVYKERQSATEEDDDDPPDENGYTRADSIVT